MQKQQIEEMVESFKKTKEEFTSKMKYTFGLFFKEFFHENPEVKEITWTQYTPYFADGDVCEFGVNFYDILNIDVIENLTPERKKELQTKENDLEKLLRKIPEDIFKDMFGDHAEVTATAEGFDVTQYDHE